MILASNNQRDLSLSAGRQCQKLSWRIPGNWVQNRAIRAGTLHPGFHSWMNERTSVEKQSPSQNERVFVDVDFALRFIKIRPGGLVGAIAWKPVFVWWWGSVPRSRVTLIMASQRAFIRPHCRPMNGCFLSLPSDPVGQMRKLWPRDGMTSYSGTSHQRAAKPGPGPCVS